MRASLIVAAAALLSANLVHAHHGVAAVGVSGSEGPGAALETTSALPLPQSTAFAMLKSEYVPFQRRAFAEPENKNYSSFNMVALGFGVRPWLSVYLFEPFNAKAQDGVGRNMGFGDPNVMLTLALKYDEGIRLVPERESLDELTDWHFSLWLASTIPLGQTETRDRRGAFFAPDMQTGFGTPSPSAGAAVLKQLSEDLTWLADVSYQYFLEHEYSYTRYRFGGETRANTGLSWRIWGRDDLRVDGCAELGGLRLQRDHELAESGAMEPLRASGGTILYGGLGVKLTWGALSVALGGRRAIAQRLNEEAEQQGSEGLESFRAALTLGYSSRL